MQSSTSVLLEMVVVPLPVMPITPTTAMTLLSAKRVSSSFYTYCSLLTAIRVCVSSLLIAEIKRIIQESEIMKYWAVCIESMFIINIQQGR